MPLIAIGMPGPFEWVIIFGIVLLLFGARRIPEVFGSIGKGLKSFRDAQNEPLEDSDEVKPD